MKLSEELRACKGVHKVSTWMIELAEKVEAEADQLRFDLQRANQRSNIFESNCTIQRGVVDTLKLELLNSADCILSRNPPNEIHAIACSMQEMVSGMLGDNSLAADYLTTKHELLKEAVIRLTGELKKNELDYCSLMERYDEKCDEVYNVTIECCRLKHQIQTIKKEWEKSDAADVTAEEKLERLVSLLYNQATGGQ